MVAKTRTVAQVINLVLVDSHAMFREVLSRTLGSEQGLAVIGEYGSYAEALASLGEGFATIVLLEVNINNESTIEFLLECRKRHFRGQILVVTAGTSGGEAVQLIQAGIAGIAHKSRAAHELIEIIRQVAMGEIFLETEYVGALCRSIDRTTAQPCPLFTNRDRTVLRLLTQGLKNWEIAARLHITEGGVKSSVRQIFGKLGVRTRTQAVKIALQEFKGQL